MPAFDPVRDAVLNSPSVPSPSLPARMHIELPTASSSASSDSRPSLNRNDSTTSTGGMSTPLTRRATDLSVLLNSDPAPLDTPLFTPTTPRPPATLSHLLADEKLSSSAPLRRRSTDASNREGSYFAWPGSSVTSSVTVAESPQSTTGLALPGSLPTPQPPASVSVIRSPVTPTLSNIVSPSTSDPSPAGHSTSQASTPRPSSSHSHSSRASTTPAQTQPPAQHASRKGSNASMAPPPQPSTPPVSKPSPRQTAARPVGHSSLPPKPAPLPEPSALPPLPSSDGTRSKIPYAPVHRRTPASSVLIPLSPAEMDRYRNFPGGVGSMILRKRKREDGDGVTLGKRARDDEEADDRKRRRTNDVGLVVEHYNARPDVGVTQRQDSPIIGLKSFNNWVKSVLITRFAHPALVASPEVDGGGRNRGVPSRGRVLDLGCGKGGDLTKWSKARVREYVGVDIAAISVDQARLRHAQLRGGPRFAASFFALDCYAHNLRDSLPPTPFSRPFDVVSMQFCMHYAFESEQKARCMLRNVAENLRPGGIFLGTVPNSELLLERLDALPPDAEELSFGNSVYTIRFEDRTNRPVFGHRYWFFLRDAVDDVPEYIVRWDNFVSVAAEYGLHIVYKEEFHQMFEEHHEHAEFGPLLERMRVVDANGESQMDEDQWEAANIYISFAFEKR